MKRIIAIADQSTLPLLKFLAAINVLFLLSLAAMLGMAVGQASAGDTACSGNDMLVEMQDKDPGAYAKMRAEADATENGNARLWKVEKKGVEPSYLFGTMHVTDQRITRLPPAAQGAYNAAGTVVLETVDILDQDKMASAVLQRPELMMFTDSTTLPSLLPADEIEAFNRALDERGIPPYSVEKMKPWIISTVVALPACELARKAGGAPVLDEKLGRDAQKHGKKLEGLETAIGQIEAMASLPMKFHVQGLVDTLKLGSRMNDVNETTIALYTNGDIGMFWPLFRSLSPSAVGDEGYAAFEQTMVTARNKTMAESAQPIIDRGNAFIAIGALHLPGPDGLVSLLRKAGYTVTASAQ